MRRRLSHDSIASRGRPRGASCRARALLTSVCLALAAGLVVAAGQSALLGRPEQVAVGIELLGLSDAALLDPPGPVVVHALRLDPREVDLRVAQADERVSPTATVLETAARNGALAAVNAGFFDTKTGRPVGLLKVDGRLVSSGPLPRGAVAIVGRSWRRSPRLVFDQVGVSRLGDEDAPPRYSTKLGTSPKAWAGSRGAVAGAGLLLRAGADLSAEERAPERLADAFVASRHPRTMIGSDKSGFIWLVTVDGRNPALSLGMTFVELQRLAHRLGLADALNLDGGGSTTMVVRGQVVNHPSDPAGARAVSSAILVFPRGR